MKEKNKIKFLYSVKNRFLYNSHVRNANKNISVSHTFLFCYCLETSRDGQGDFLVTVDMRAVKFRMIRVSTSIVLGHLQQYLGLFIE